MRSADATTQLITLRQVTPYLVATFPLACDEDSCRILSAVVTDSWRSPAPGCVLFVGLAAGAGGVEVAVDGFAGNAEGVGDLGDGVAVLAVRGYLGVHAVGDVDLAVPWAEGSLSS